MPEPPAGRRSAEEPRGFPRLGWLAAVVLLAGLLRFGLVELCFPVGLLGDELHYVDTATHIALGLGHRSNLRGAVAATPPAHPWLLSHFVDPGAPPVDPAAADPRASGRDSVRADRVKGMLRAQAGVGTLLVLATALLGAALFDARVGLVAAAAAALHPTLVAFSHYLWATPLFALLVTLGLAAAAWQQRAPHVARAALTGACFGLATLTREVGLGIAGACALWWVVAAGPGRRRRALGHAALLLACALAVVAPWTLRNQVLLGRPVPVSTIGWMALREGNTPVGDDWPHPDERALHEFRREWFDEPDELARSALARREALAEIAAAQPGWILDKLVRNVPVLWGPDTYLPRKLRSGAYGRPPWPLESALRRVSIAVWLAVLLLGLAGVALARGRHRRLLFCLVAGVVTLVHVVANASSRYALPLVPLLLVYAASSADALLARSRRRAQCGPPQDPGQPSQRTSRMMARAQMQAPIATPKTRPRAGSMAE